MSGARLAEGGLIDRSTSLSFTFDGKRYSGHPGDTLASALLANGQRLVGRSFKYHRPRGLLSAGPEEPNALVELRSGARREPNTRATEIELYDGLEAASQNRWPSLGFDLMALNGLLSPFLGAGFYYKTFMWPAAFWEKVYEPLIRRAAGLGRASGLPDPDHYEKAFAFCDVLVVGSGPAGLTAALTAGRAGARVILVEQDHRLGGRLLADRVEVDDTSGSAWVERVTAELDSLPDMRIMRRTSLAGLYDHGVASAVERVSDHLPEPPEHAPRQRLWRIVAKRIVVAAGAIERPLVFGNNDRPGIMLAGAIRTYVNRFAVLPGRRAVVAGAAEGLRQTVADLMAGGASVEAIVASDDAAPLRNLADAADARLFGHATIARAEGGREVQAVAVADASGALTGVDCDLVAMTGGWNPLVHLTSHLGHRPVWSAALQAFVPGVLPPGLSVAGAAAGEMPLERCLATGAEAGSKAATELGFSASAWPPPRVAPEAAVPAVLPRLAQIQGKAFVDFQNDVTVSDVKLAEQEGFRSVEHLKRYTTLGMATDQGKTSNVAGLALMAELTAKHITEVGTTTFRPPFTPVAFGALAGHHKGQDFMPTRLPPTHDWSAEQGAVFVETGLWLRAQWYPKPGEADWLTSVDREIRATRGSVGICDVSTLGKIDIKGPDAAEFLDRVYSNAFKSLPVGRARYGLMLREDGFVMDDGTTSRLGEAHFFMTTTTANAGKVMQHLEFCHQVLWPELDLQMISVSDRFAQVAVAGPRSRDLLRKVVDSQHDISNEAFPYLAAGEVTLMGGVPGRLYRISFSGELAYEVGVPAQFGFALIQALAEAGRAFDVTPYGLEALNAMRIEKGHVAGAELNGQTTARDLGLGKMCSTRKDYIGRIMKERPALVAPDRPSFVGFKPVDRAARLRAGAHFIPVGKPAHADHDEGHVTSVAHSPMLGHWIGLGLIRRGAERHGERVRAVDPVRGGDVEVELCSPIFFDPEGVRLRA